MRPKLGTHLIMACALALGACAMEDTPADNPADNNLTSNRSDPKDNPSADTPTLATIPEELSFDNLPDATANDRDDDDDHDCKVVVRCSDDGDDDDDDDDGDDDHGDHGHASFCSKHCSHGEARHKAKEKCHRKCHHSDCRHMRDEGKCHGGHDHDDWDASPDAFRT